MKHIYDFPGEIDFGRGKLNLTLFFEKLDDVEFVNNITVDAIVQNISFDFHPCL